MNPATRLCIAPLVLPSRATILDAKQIARDPSGLFDGKAGARVLSITRWRSWGTALRSRPQEVDHDSDHHETARNLVPKELSD